MAKNRSFHISTLGSRITAIVSVTLVLIIIGLMLLGGSMARQATHQVRSNVALVVKLELQTTESDVNSFRQYLDAQPWVSSMLFTSADDVLQQEMEYNSDILELIDENPYSSEMEIKLRDEYVCADSILSISRRLESLEYVDEVVAPAQVADSISRVVGRMEVLLGIVAVALLLISVVLIYNTVSLSVYSRRLVIHSMKLVGATPGFIRRPFVLSGIASGAIAAVIASAILCGLTVYVSTRSSLLGFDGQQLAFSPAELVIVCGIIVVLGIAICGISSLLATNKYINANFDEYYK